MIFVAAQPHGIISYVWKDRFFPLSEPPFSIKQDEAGGAVSRT